MTVKRTSTPGISARHSRRCAMTTGGKRCSGSPVCVPTYLATVATGSRGRRIRQSFQTLPAAKRWQADQRRALHDGADLHTRETVGDALDAFAAQLQHGDRVAKGMREYKASTARSYLVSITRLRGALDGRLAATPLRELDAVLVQDVVDELLASSPRHANGMPRLDADGKPKLMSASAVKNTVMPLRKIADRAIARKALRVDPFTGVNFPASDEVPRRAATAAEAVGLLDALDYPDRAYFALAFYAGLRAGEISGLRWGDIQPPSISISAAYCSVSHELTTPKSRAGTRTAPAASQLFPILDAYRDTCTRTGDDDLVFPATGNGWRGKESPALALNGDTVKRRATRAWESCNLTGVNLHEARHTYASLMAAAGVSLHELSGYMGHSSIEVTAKRYAHLYDDQRDEAARKLSAAVERANTTARLAQLDK